MKIQEVNTQTQEVLVRDANEVELANYQLLQEKNANDLVEAQAKATAKTAAQAKLAALGLTVEDLQALGL